VIRPDLIYKIFSNLASTGLTDFKVTEIPGLILADQGNEMIRVPDFLKGILVEVAENHGPAPVVTTYNYIPVVKHVGLFEEEITVAFELRFGGAQSADVVSGTVIKLMDLKGYITFGPVFLAYSNSS